MKKMMRAFTLAELLLCIGIIGIVSAMGMVITKHSTERAYNLYYYTGYINLYNAIADGKASRIDDIPGLMNHAGDLLSPENNVASAGPQFPMLLYSALVTNLDKANDFDSRMNIYDDNKSLAGDEDWNVPRKDLGGGSGGSSNSGSNGSNNGKNTIDPNQGTTCAKYAFDDPDSTECRELKPKDPQLPNKPKKEDNENTGNGGDVVTGSFGSGAGSADGGNGGNGISYNYTYRKGENHAWITMSVPVAKTRGNNGQAITGFYFSNDNSGYLIPIAPAEGSTAPNLQVRRDLLPAYIDDGKVGRNNVVNRDDFNYAKPIYGTYKDAYCSIRGASGSIDNVISCADGTYTNIKRTENGTQLNGFLKIASPQKVH